MQTAHAGLSGPAPCSLTFDDITAFRVGVLLKPASGHDAFPSPI
jgi:hypothetical protein